VIVGIGKMKNFRKRDFYLLTAIYIDPLVSQNEDAKTAAFITHSIAQI
jgi:hypothetical protein